MILESRTGSSLHDLVEDRLADPLALDDTELFTGDRPLDDRVPRLLFDLNGDGELIDVRDLPVRAAFTTKWAEGGMLSTATDLVDWAMALWGTEEVIGDARLRAEMVDTTDDGYGFGAQGVCPCRGAPMDRVRFSGTGHQGDFYGSRAIVWYWPDVDVAVALLTNQSPVNGLLLERAAIETRAIAVGPDPSGL